MGKGVGWTIMADSGTYIAHRTHAVAYGIVEINAQSTKEEGGYDYNHDIEHHECHHIIGSLLGDGSAVYFHRDNGIGVDSAFEFSHTALEKNSDAHPFDATSRTATAATHKHHKEDSNPQQGCPFGIVGYRKTCA